ncbi:hypothetical protein [Actinoplanes sp. NPDC026619]|uniref:hypothetical protein n=1 Tax=Actinoplanes sp. NPDC026619 TaxID=3155798 RepID=UPI0033E31C8F
MSTAGSSAFQIISYALVLVLCAYGGGRVHQWYKHSMDRDQSFREGYNQGYHSLFVLAARNTRPATGVPNPIDRHDQDRRSSEPLRD